MARIGSPPMPAGIPDGPGDQLHGLALRNPLVASASPLSFTVDGVRRMAGGEPVAVKLSPHFSSPGEIALRLGEAGADGLVLSALRRANASAYGPW
jgi:hypothetical protein